MENPWKSQKHIHNMFHDFPLKTANIHCRVWLLEGSQSCTIQYIIMSWQLQARPSSAVKLRHQSLPELPKVTRTEWNMNTLPFVSHNTAVFWVYQNLSSSESSMSSLYIFSSTRVFFSYSNWNHKQQKQQQKQHQLVPWDAGNHKIPETPGHLWDFPWKTNEMTGCINTIHVQSIEIRQISIDHWGSENGLQYIYRVWNCIIMCIYIYILQYPKMSILIVTMMINHQRTSQQQ